MIRFIDDILNKITMYRLVFYELLALIAVATILGTFKLVPYDPLNILYSAAFFFVFAWLINKIFAYFFAAPSNPESTYITAFILALIVSPAQSFGDTHFLFLAGWAAAWAVASKYVVAIKHKHLFNPAAFGVAMTALFLHQGATWWVGTLWMLPFVSIGGFLIARKIRRMDMVIWFGISIVASIILLNMGQGGTAHIIQESLLYAPAVFLGTVMLTEPLTTPPTRFLRFWYAALVGFLFAPEVHIGSFYFTPELALLAGNLFVYLVSPKVKLLLRLKDRVQLTPDTYEFVFASERDIAFDAGQYLEWTLVHPHADARGIRRYFTIASSPTDRDFRLGVKFYGNGSTFKKKLLSLRKGDTVVASQLAGEFVLPRSKKKKLAFIAGGIGVTPFASMFRYMLDTHEKRDIVMLYANRTLADIAYVDLLDKADTELGIRVIPVFSEEHPPSTIDAHLIQTEMPDYKERMFYLSGPQGMVNAYSDLLLEMGIHRSHIKKDFFPGFA